MEMLLCGHKYSGDSTFHMNRCKTRGHYLKKPFPGLITGSFHVVDYDTITNEVFAKKTIRGKIDDSDGLAAKPGDCNGYNLKM